MTTITSRCPSCGRAQRKPDLCPACYDQDHDEITSILPGVAWILRLIWWKLTDVARDLYKFASEFWQALKPIIIRERWGVILFCGAISALVIAMAWLSVRG